MQQLSPSCGSLVRDRFFRVDFETGCVEHVRLGGRGVGGFFIFSPRPESSYYFSTLFVLNRNPWKKYFFH